MGRLLVTALTMMVVAVMATHDGSLHASQLYADLADFSGDTPRLDTLLGAIEPKLHALYQLCRIDSVCASNFYLSSSAGVETAGNDAARRLQASDTGSDEKKFNRLLILWAQRDDCPLRPNAVRGQVTLSDYTDADAPWWLTVLSQVRFCGENQVWELGQGCVMKPDRVDDDGKPVRAKSTLDSVGQPLAVLAVAVFSILILAAIVGGVFIAHRSFAQMVKYIRGSEDMFRGVAPKHSAAMDKGELWFTHVGSQVDDDEDEAQFSAADMVAHVAAPMRR